MLGTVKALAIHPVKSMRGQFVDTAKLGFEAAWVPKGIAGAEGLRLAEFASIAR